MNSIAWWPTLAIVTTAAIIDLFTRRVPNWLVLPFLAAGVVTQAITGGWAGCGRSFAGIGLAAVLFGVPFLLGGMGMGDVKLAGAVGAWIGPWQFFMAFILTGIAGGIFALAYAAWNRALGKCLDDTGGIISDITRLRVGRGGKRLTTPGAISIPYAPAIAVGTVFSFFAR